MQFVLRVYRVRKIYNHFKKMTIKTKKKKHHLQEYGRKNTILRKEIKKNKEELTK
jgi:cell division protein FtsB